MIKAHNFLFIAITAIVFVSCLGNAAVRAFTIGEDAPIQSYLEGREYQLRPDFSVEAFAGRTYQDQMEQYLADNVPERETVLLGNAFAQNLAISCANAFFGFPAYQTFYGSEYLELPAYDAAAETPTSQKAASPELIASRVEIFGEAMQGSADINWAFALVERSRNSASNPAHGLSSAPADYEYYRERFLSQLPDACRIVDLRTDDPEQYFEHYFRTDHHWQVSGALVAYDRIMASFGEKPRDFGEPMTVYEGPFYGSEARSGLLTRYADSLEDISHDKPAWEVEVDGEKKEIAWLNEGFDPAFDGYQTKERFSNAYAEHFHPDRGHIHIHNPKGTGSLLIIGDSFTNNIDYLFAYTYADVHILDPRHYDGHLGDFLKETEVDDAVFLMASNTMVSNTTAAFLK